MDKNGATKATYLDNLLNWTKPVSLRQIGTICWRLATILKLLSRKNTLHVIYSHFQQVKTQDESLTKYQGGSRQHHVGSWNIFDLGFSKLSPDFSSMFVEFQSKYHREEQIWAQIWLKSGDGIIQIAVFWHLQFALFLSTNNFFFLFSLPSILLLSFQKDCGAFLFPGFICAAFYGFLQLPRKRWRHSPAIPLSLWSWPP